MQGIFPLQHNFFGKVLLIIKLPTEIEADKNSFKTIILQEIHEKGYNPCIQDLEKNYAGGGGVIGA